MDCPIPIFGVIKAFWGFYSWNWSQNIPAIFKWICIAAWTAIVVYATILVLYQRAFKRLKKEGDGISLFQTSLVVGDFAVAFFAALMVSNEMIFRTRKSNGPCLSPIFRFVTNAVSGTLIVWARLLCYIGTFIPIMAVRGYDTKPEVFSITEEDLPCANISNVFWYPRSGAHGVCAGQDHFPLKFIAFLTFFGSAIDGFSVVMIMVLLYYYRKKVVGSEIRSNAQDTRQHERMVSRMILAEGALILFSFVLRIILHSGRKIYQLATGRVPSTWHTSYIPGNVMMVLLSLSAPIFLFSTSVAFRTSYLSGAPWSRFPKDWQVIAAVVCPILFWLLLTLCLGILAV